MSSDRLNEARRLLNEGEAAKAEPIFLNLLEQSPGQAIACCDGLARCARKRGDRAASLEWFLKVVALAPAEPGRRINVADDLLALDRLDEAEALYRQVLAEAPQNIPAHSGLGYTLRRRNLRAEALAMFQQAALLQPENPQRYRDMAAELRALGRFGEEVAVLEQALALSPTHPDIGAALVTATRQFAGPAAAAARCRAFLESRPDSHGLRLELAHELLTLGRLDEAEAELRALVGAGYEHLRVPMGLGYLARRRGDRATAMTWFHEAASRFPDKLQPQFEIVTELREAGDFDAARQRLRTLLRTPNIVEAAQLPFVHGQLAQTERAAGQHEAALAAWQEALALAPWNLDLLADMAATERRLGKIDESAAHLRTVLATNPAHPAAVRQMADMLRASGDKEAAYELCREAADAQPGNINIQNALADALHALGRTGEAITRLAEAEELNGLIPPLRLKRIVLLRQIGFLEEARALARAASAADPSNFEFAFERFQCELPLPDDDGLASALAALTPATQTEQARRLQCEGLAQESDLNLDKAIACYQKAVALSAEAGGTRQALARARLLSFDVAGALRDLHVSMDTEAPTRLLQGKSLNISQSLLGQLADEFRMDDAVLRQIQSLWPLPAQQRAQPLLELAAAAPDNTGSAVALLITLRQAGLLPPPKPSEVKIPKQIFQFWDTAPPAEILEVMQSWRDHHPGWRVELFDDARARDYLGRFFSPAALRVFQRATDPAQKADLFRLAVLAREGGVYADADDRCLHPLETLLPDAAQLVLYQEDLGTIGNNFIAVTPHHPVILAALQAGVAAIMRGDSDLLWLATGPGLMTRALVKVLAAGGDATSLPAGIAILHRRRIGVAVAMHCAIGYKRTRSHWSERSFATGRTGLLAAPTVQESAHARA